MTEFRPMRRKSRAITDDEARELLLNEKRGVLAVNGDEGYPLALPLDYLYEPGENRIYFHGAKQGHKVDALAKSDKVCFTVFGGDFHKEGEWAPYVRSTVVFGRCHLENDPELAVQKVRKLALRYYPTAEEVEAEIASGIAGMQLYVIEVEHLTGKQIKEK